MTFGRVLGSLLAGLLGLTSGCAAKDPTHSLDDALDASTDETEPIEDPVPPAVVEEMPEQLYVDVYKRRLMAERIVRHAPCPEIWFPLEGPMIQGGPTFDRLSARIGGRHGHGTTDVADAHHPVRLPGTRFMVALDYSSSCMMGWSHRHCFVTEAAVYCNESDDIVAFVKDLGLDRDPRQLDDDQWIQLVATFSEGEKIVPSSFELPVCYWEPTGEALAMVDTGVVHHDDGLTVSVTFIDARGDLSRDTLTIDPSGTRVGHRLLQRHVQDEDDW